MNSAAEAVNNNGKKIIQKWTGFMHKYEKWIIKMHKISF